jgi:hypothetical protein
LTIKEQVTHKLANAGGQLRVKSALNPVLWLCALVTAPALIFSNQSNGTVQTWIIVIAFLPVVVACIGFLFLLLFDRDKLQSEEYQIRKQSLEIIQEKGGKLIVNPMNIEAITNPDYPRLTNGTGGE